MHLGHQAVIRQVRERSLRNGLPSLVIIFEPQPQEYFSANAAPARLTTLREKLVLLDSCGLDKVLCLRFDRRLAAMEAREFVDKVLVAGLGVRHLVVGDDFRFGHRRAGDFALLCEAGATHDFTVENTHTYIYAGARVSSTRIRAALEGGRLDEARHLLGRPYAISGRVIHGDKRGRQWGFPTANLPLGSRRPPLTGIFTVSVTGLGDSTLPGVASLGNRPVVDGKQTLLEVHLLDFNGEIYGRRINVEFLQKLRDEEHFPNVNALIEQMSVDKREAERYFARSR